LYSLKCKINEFFSNPPTLYKNYFSWSDKKCYSTNNSLTYPYVSLTVLKILPFEKAQIYLAFYSLNRIFAAMKKNTLFIILVAIMCLAACKKEKQEASNIGLNTSIEGDSTLYGLACDGCTDSVLVFLSGKGGDPVSYDIISAMKQRKVIGRPHVGDWVAVLVDPADSTKASMVINLDELKATWIQEVTPKMKERNGNIALSDDEKEEIDSVLKDMLKPVNIGFSLKRHYTAAAVGMPTRAQMADDSPVIMPRPKFYTNWHVFNGRLVLTEKQFGDIKDNKRTIVERYDTAAFVMKTRDSLVLQFKDGIQSYSRQRDEEKD